MSSSYSFFLFFAMPTLTFFPGLSTAQSDSLVDVFPLAVGNQWTYCYHVEMHVNTVRSARLTPVRQLFGSSIGWPT